MDLISIDKSRFNDAVKAYFLWKELDSLVRNSHTRGININEAITETLLCYVGDFKLNKGSGGDAFDERTQNIIEIKATNNYHTDTTSFSTNEHFDFLYFVRLDKRNDIMYFYNLGINSDYLKTIKVNAKETLGDQQRAGRRPRFSIIKSIIEPNQLQPFANLDLMEKKVEHIKA